MKNITIISILISALSTVYACGGEEPSPLPEKELSSSTRSIAVRCRSGWYWDGYRCVIRGRH